MNTETVYRLTVHFYPDLQPDEMPRNRANYNAHEFWFRHQPTREDFKRVVECTPWALYHWEDTLIPWCSKTHGQNYT